MFTPTEIEKFGITGLRNDVFIRSHLFYYTPATASRQSEIKMSAEEIRSGLANERSKDQFKDVLLRDLDDAEQTRNRRKRKNDSEHIQKLKSASFIGATISGAAKYHDLISDLGIKYVLVDEAAMILEADLIAALPTSAKRVILLGDHKQVSPSVDMAVWKKHEDSKHVLSKSKLYGLNLSPGKEGMGSQMSVFERLLLLDHSHVELTVQYRMPSVLADNIRRDKAKHADWPLYFDFQYTDCSSNDINWELRTRREEFERMWTQGALSGRGDDGGDNDAGAPPRPAAVAGAPCPRSRPQPRRQGRGRLLWSTIEPEPNEDGNEGRQMCLSPFLKFIDHDFDTGKTNPSDTATENPHVRSLLAWFSF